MSPRKRLHYQGPLPRREIAARRREIVAELLIAESREALFESVFNFLQESFPAHVLEAAGVNASKLASQTALHQDLRWLRATKNIRAAVRPDRYVRLTSVDTTLDRRFKEEVRAKESIGRTAAMLIAPTPYERQNHLETAIRLVPDLEVLYGQFVRLLVLDSGSTTYRVANTIDSTIHTPDETRMLSELRIVTNFVRLSQLFEGKRRSPDLIYIGGKVRKDTGAIVGHLAETCLDAWRLSDGRADISVIGTTHITGEGYFCSDHEEEASTKKRLLHAARLKCIVASAEKIFVGVGARAWVFAALGDVKFVLTDARIREVQQNPKDEGARINFLRMAEKNKVVVLAETKERVGDYTVVVA